MTGFVSALPMYDWPEARAETDAVWARLRDALRAAGLAAPDRLARRNADLPPVPGGIRDGQGNVIAPDPATLRPEGLDLHTLWRHPSLLFAQACWGPLELGLNTHVRVIGQPDYSAYEGGAGSCYSSAIVMRKEAAAEWFDGSVRAPEDGRPSLPLDILRGGRFAYNSLDSMSGIIALTRDLEAAGKNVGIFGERIETGAHRASLIAVAEGRADICAVDCRTWALARRFEPRAAGLRVAGWTGLRPGLPYITALEAPHGIAEALRDFLAPK